jgi:hypothetical protein
MQKVTLVTIQTVKVVIITTSNIFPVHKTMIRVATRRAVVTPPLVTIAVNQPPLQPHPHHCTLTSTTVTL